jgi:hypothetical protein
MAVDDFWMNVRTAARLPVPQSLVDSPQLDAEAIDRALRITTAWLSPSAVAGFFEQDFSFLTDAERLRLAELHRDFLEAVTKKSQTALPAGDLIEKVLPIFRGIVQALEYDRYGDPTAFRLGKLIEKAIAARRPPELAELRFNTGSDHSGDPALWIWAFLSADVSDSDEKFLETAQEFRDLLDPAARQVSPDRWPYISFRSMAEQSEPVEAA